MNTLRARLLAAVAYVLVLVLLALAVPFGVSITRRAEAEVKGQAASDALLLASSVAERFGAGVPPGARRAGGERRPRAGRRRRFARASRRRLGRRPPARRSYADRPEIASVLATGATAQGRRRSDTRRGAALHRRARPGRRACGSAPCGSRGASTRSTRASAGTCWRSPDRRRGARARPRARLASRRLARAAAEGARGDGAATRPRRPGGARRDVRVRGAAGGRDGTSTRWRTGSAASSRHSASSSPTRPTSCARPRQVCSSGSRPPRSRRPIPGSRELAAAEREVERLARMLTALLTLAREGRRRPRPARSISPPRPTCARPLGRRGRARRPALELEHDGRAVWAAASPEDVAIVLDNPIENALLYSPAGSTVRIEPAARVGTAAIGVVDEGPGLGGEDPETSSSASREGARAGARRGRASGSRSSGRSRGAGAATRRSATRPAAARAPR